MRIVQVVSGIGWVGGVQEYVSGLSRGLVGQGHEVVVLAGGRPPPDGPAPHPLAAGLDIRFHPKRRIAKRYLYPSGLRRSLRALAPWADIVHVHQPFALGTWLAATTAAPLAATLYLHPEHLERPPARRRRLQLQALIARLDLVVGVSHAELELISTVRTPRRSGVVWPALEHLPDGEPKDLGRPSVVYVGRLTRSKNLDTLVRAFALLPPHVRTAVVGGGPDAGYYRALCAETGLDPAVVVSEDVSDAEIDRYLTQASVFVSVSREESFGIAPMRAIAHGCRPVLSDIPSHREIVSTLGAGVEFLVDPFVDGPELARTILSAAASPALPPRVAAAVPTWAEAATAAADLYRQAVSGRRLARYRKPESWRASR